MTTFIDISNFIVAFPCQTYSKTHRVKIENKYPNKNVTGATDQNNQNLERNE